MKVKMQLLEFPRDLPEQIMVEETVVTFGYNPKYLKVNSEKLVVWKCLICGIVKNKKHRLASISCICGACSNKINANTNKSVRGQKIKQRWKANGHPRLGKRHSIESRKKMSENRVGITPKISPENKKKIIEALKNRKVSDETRKKLSSANKGKKLSEEHKLKISKNHADVRGKNNPAYGKNYWLNFSQQEREKRLAMMSDRMSGPKNPMFGKPQTTSKHTPYTDIKGRYFKFKSTWEAVFAEFLDSKLHDWEYEHKAFEILYVYDGKEKHGTYSPDFFLPGHGFYVEIKGYWRKGAKEKYEAFLQQYPEENIILYTEKELATELGIYVR
ncbi:MAG TPA: NUMOD3 domain-containing DNA-binding protein [Leptospiraceae bacterium]|nr:NUMOD3 domain-containing DNA-binding protein [Leptospiraceae bacterium]